MAHTRFLGWPFAGLVSTQSGMTAAIDQLTEKEKETLRLIVRGHDAKSAAIELDLSVHTINERLRSARRKLDVTSSREAARVLYESEAQAAERTPKNLHTNIWGMRRCCHRPMILPSGNGAEARLSGLEELS